MKLTGLRINFVALPTLTFLLGIGVSCIFYWLFLSPAKTSQITKDISPATVHTGIKSDRNEATPRLSSETSLSPKPTSQSLDTLSQFESPFDKQQTLLTLLSKSDDSDLDELLVLSQDVTNSYRPQLQAAILQRLSQINPKRALAQALELDSQYRDQLVSSVFVEWAHSDLDEAISNARSLRKTSRESALNTILDARTDLSVDFRQKIARELGNEQMAIDLIVEQEIEQSIKDPEKSWDKLVTQIQDDRQRATNLAPVALAWVEKRSLSVVDQIYSSITNLETRFETIKSVLVSVAETDPSGAFEQALALPSDQHNMIAKSVSRTWARSDPQAALIAISNVESVTLRQKLGELVVESWANEEPYEILKSINVLPAQLHAIAVSASIGAIARTSPLEAARMVQDMEIGPTKAGAASALVSTWSEHDVKSALDWILNKYNDDKSRRGMISMVLYRLVQADPELAMTTAVDHLANAGTRGLEINVILNLAWMDADKAIELLPQIREPRAKLSAYQNVAGALLGIDDADLNFDKVFDLAQELPESDRTQYFEFIIPNMANKYAEGLLDSIDRLPTVELKSRAASNLIRTNYWNKELTDEQIEYAKTFLTKRDAESL